MKMTCKWIVDSKWIIGILIEHVLLNIGDVFKLFFKHDTAECDYFMFRRIFCLKLGIYCTII